MAKITLEVPGKVIISGEHAVVYGAPALVAAVDLGNTFSFSALRAKEFHIRINQDQYKVSIDEGISELEAYKQKGAGQTRFKKAGLGLVIGEILSKLQVVPQYGATINIKTLVPPGSGLGHSASLVGGLAKGLFTLYQKKAVASDVRQIIYKTESYFHGRPSGVDQEAILRGGVLWYRNRKRKTILQKEIRRSFGSNFFLLSTGKPSSTTAESVHKVRQFFARNNRRKKQLLRNFETTTSNLSHALKDGSGKDVGSLINQNQVLLQKIGVSTARADKIFQDMQQIGGAAKITGAGTAKGEKSGMMLLFHEQRDEALEYLAKQPYPYFEIKMGARGLLGR
ncbi:mevalonate kinase [Patescibacteria group bacterium]|nr:mevalonate kinase [Patescibacteria group bacterium]